MNTEVVVKNWETGSSAVVLASIHQAETNIVAYNRGVAELTTEIDELLTKELNLTLRGDIENIQNALIEQLDAALFANIIADVSHLLQLFSTVSGADSFRLFLGTVNTNMCRKFHTDINDLRMLCTYSGPGTLWLKEESVNRNMLGLSSSQEEDIVVDENAIQQAETGSVLILKGAIYPKKGTKAAVHRSPIIEETGERRLLLRIDTNEFLNF